MIDASPFGFHFVFDLGPFLLKPGPLAPASILACSEHLVRTRALSFQLVPQPSPLGFKSLVRALSLGFQLVLQPSPLGFKSLVRALSLGG